MTSNYYPVGWHNEQQEQQRVRQLLIQTLSGSNPLTVKLFDNSSWPGPFPPAIPLPPAGLDRHPRSAINLRRGRVASSGIGRNWGSMRQPIRVYLDNQDLSRLYRPQSAAFQIIRNDLLECKEDGTATFHYSYWHVFEFLQPCDIRFMSDRRDRVRFLKAICAENALPYFADIISGRPVAAVVWLPAEVLDDIVLDIDRSLDAELAKRTLNREARRKAANGSFRRAAFARTFVGSSFERQIAHRYGLTESFVRDGTFSKLMRGEISDGVFRARFARMFCDPEFFFRKWFVEEQRECVINEQVAAIGKKWAETIAGVRQKIDAYATARRDAVRNRKAFYDRLREMQIPPEAKKLLADRLPRPPPPLTIQDALNTSRIRDDRLRYLECYMRHYLVAPKTKASDIADLMHLFYAHDIDLIRCDRAMYSIMGDCPHLQNCLGIVGPTKQDTRTS